MTLWPYIRVYLLNTIYNRSGVFGVSFGNTFKANPKYFYLLLRSLGHLSRRKTVFCIPNRPAVHDYCRALIKSKGLKEKDIAYVSTLVHAGNQSALPNVYVDPIKILARAASLFRKKKAGTRFYHDIVNRFFLEGYVMTIGFVWFLKLIQPKTIYVVNWYNLYPLVIAANKLGIPIYDVQHGIIYPRHYGYNLNNGDFPMAIPQKFVLWDGLFSDSINYNGLFDFEVHSRDLVNRRNVGGKRKALIASQYSISDLMREELLNQKEFLKTFDLVVLRLHPKELDQKLNGVHEFLVKMGLSNVEISLPSEIPFETDLETASCVIGVYSTCLIDSIEAGVDTYILQVEGYDNLSPYFERENCKLL
ncbi:hypothetical protein [uncultured Roseivirga sp.]|uniref:hypothetical protein n=1 Tax=uncultured Roseivirga sp. TaxID=543088 RepID=UPI000D7B479C|nr:hypothetical protein [uncultured Roseivirga sp.]PWL30930.1 MAG: hypothetical protein DCO95_05490 [Roseivirga sp. XM-24bin3]